MECADRNTSVTYVRESVAAANTARLDALARRIAETLRCQPTATPLLPVSSSCAPVRLVSVVAFLPKVPMSTFMQLLDGKRSTAIEDGIKVARNGKMFFRMDGKPVRGVLCWESGRGRGGCNSNDYKCFVVLHVETRLTPRLGGPTDPTRASVGALWLRVRSRSCDLSYCRVRIILTGHRRRRRLLNTTRVFFDGLRPFSCGPSLASWPRAVVSPMSAWPQYYTQSLYVTKEVFKALTKSGVAFSAVNPSPAGTRLLASFMPILYVCALYYFVFKKG